MKILCFIQTLDGKANNNSLESLFAAQEISKNNNAEVHAVVFNKDVATKLSSYKLNSVIYINNSELETYNPEYYLKSLELINNELNPDLLIFGHSYETRDWVPRLSARLDKAFVSDCVNVQFESDLHFIRPIYQAKLNEKIKLNNQGIVSFQAGSYSYENIIEGSCSIEEKSLDLQIDLTVRPGERFKESAEGVDLSNAEVIVSIGRGVGKIENVELVKSLAEKLNAQIGASRPVVDAGWLDHSYQIGSSGQTVSPKLYLAVGISGAIQHLVGMKGAKNIIAINKDPNAPIFEISDYAVLGDIFEILPKLIEEL
ncbi:MAG: electron transfer flavoprotein subunit alpha [Candidatus Marinimicrobia bacterium]|nr:electron transfer flavoprotein subunit alpha [Candidatus Neomarinimicrobiota bacterium]|tara:strand:+ start:13671 stop:14612 length:942 start_codon:yes stop_codon:yes gene_type:complete